MQTLQAEQLNCTAGDHGKIVTLSNGLQLEPFLMETAPLENGGIRVSTAVEVSHSSLIRRPIFEYQHSSGDTLEEAMRSGFTQWARMDLLTLMDACSHTPKHCASLEVSYGSEGAGEYQRQILLGPMAHFQEYEPTDVEEHEFCPCCLFTNSMAAFQDMLKSHDFLGIRLYASRDDDGLCEADCRVNGRDFEAALPLLRQYAAGWPQAGFEFRKQYVVIRNLPTL